MGESGSARSVAGTAGDTIVDVGQIVGAKYYLDALIGEGGLAVVYRATHIDLEDRVALKFLRASVATPDVRQRFTNEARAAVKLKSEYVCRVLDVGTHEGAPYMVMEHLQGKDLFDALKALGALPIATAVEYVIQACAGLAEAHARGIVHRDVKPENIFLVERDGWRQVKILDFGISKIALEGKITNVDLRSHDTTSMMGSPYYMSPEQIRSTRTVDHRSDIWSLGAVLFELLTNKTAFSEQNELTELVAEILEQPFRSLRGFRPDVPVELEAIVARCLEKDREKRFQSAAQLAAALLPFATKRARGPAEQAATFAHSAGMAGGELLSVPPPAKLSSDPPVIIPRPASLPHELAATMAEPSQRVEVPASVPRPSHEGPPSKKRSKMWPMIAIGVGVILGIGAVAVWQATQAAPKIVLHPPQMPSESIQPSALAPTATTSAPESSATANASTTASVKVQKPPTTTIATTVKPPPTTTSSDLEIRRTR
jgi:serine/threonine-protein kinase